MLGLSAGGAHWYFAGKIFQTGAHMRATRGIAFVITFAVACLVLSLKVGKKGFLVSESFSYKAQSTTAFIQQCWLFLPPGIQIELLSFAFERNEWKSNALVERTVLRVCLQKWVLGNWKEFLETNCPRKLATGKPWSVLEFQLFYKISVKATRKALLLSTSFLRRANLICICLKIICVSLKLFLSLGDHAKTSVLWKRKAKIHNEYSQCVQINTECGRNFVLFYRVYDFVPFLCWRNTCKRRTWSRRTVREQRQLQQKLHCGMEGRSWFAKRWIFIKRYHWWQRMGVIRVFARIERLLQTSSGRRTSGNKRGFCGNVVFISRTDKNFGKKLIPYHKIGVIAMIDNAITTSFKYLYLPSSVAYRSCLFVYCTNIFMVIISRSSLKKKKYTSMETTCKLRYEI